MELVNRTSFHARFLNTVFGEDRMLGAVVARPTFRVDGARLIPTPNEPWPIEPAPIDTPYGTFPPDTPFLSGGIDLLIMGSARAPGGKPTPEVRVDVRVGGRFSRSLRVVGDRRWQRASSSGEDDTPVVLVATPPEPFESMPLTWDRAFGGKVAVEGREFAYPANPGGRGLYLVAEEAEGNPLPNLESVDTPIQAFTDQPVPVGTAPYPAGGSLRPLNSVDLAIDDTNPEETRMRQIKPFFFNTAAPQMIIPPADGPRSGDVVEITNVGPTGSFRFTLPDLALHGHVQLENRGYLFPLHLDQIGLLVDERRVFFSYRTAFKYRVVPLERRRVTLHEGAAPDTIPADYQIAWED